MTREQFDVHLGRLIVLKGWPDDSAEWFTALSDIPEDVLGEAVTHALKTRIWFPAPAEVRADCDAVWRSRPVTNLPQPQVEELLEGGREVTFPNPFGGSPLKLKITREWRYDCDSCRDTGWVTKWCGEGRSRFPNVASTQCGRRIEHGPHEFVERCQCLEWNPTLRRHRDAGQKFSQAPEKVTA